MTSSTFDWYETTLGESFQTVTGNTPPKSIVDFYGDEIPFVKPPDLAGGEVGGASDGLSSSGAQVARIAPAGSILVSCIGNLGKIGLAIREVAFNQQINAILPSPGLAIPRLLYWISLSPQFQSQLAAMSSGTTVPIVNKSRFNSIKLRLPPVGEQRRIVSILDQAFAALDRARAHAEANLADIDELLEISKTQLLQQAGKLGRSVSFSEVVSIESSLVDPKLPENIDLPHLGAGNMVTNSDALLNVQTAREEKLKSGKHTFEPGMVLYSKIRPYLKKVARPDFRGLCSADVYPLSTSSELDRDFLFHMLLGRDFTDYAISGSDRAGMPKVNRAHLFRYRFSLPPLEVQKEVARNIDAVMATTTKVASHYQAKLADLAQLRQSLLQQAFSGQLT